MKKKLLSLLLLPAIFSQLSCIGHEHIKKLAGIATIPHFVFIKPEAKRLSGGDANDLQSIQKSLFTLGFLVSAIKANELETYHFLENDVLIIPHATAITLNKTQDKRIGEIVKRGTHLFFDGNSSLYEIFGIKSKRDSITITRIRDKQYPENILYWSTPARVKPIDTIASSYKTLCIDDSLQEAIAIHGSFGKGKFICYAPLFDPVTNKGYTRFPYLAESFENIFGIHPIAERQASEMFFDPGMHTDTLSMESMARQWRANNIKCIHAAGWYLDNDYDYARLLKACHENGILVSCWLETPMISKQFWERHPEWREKTAFLKDANIDWRLLMNLADSNCRKAIFRELDDLLMKNDWDGVNLAELYFEPSPVGPNLPENFTPMNTVVREEFKKIGGFDPIQLFNPSSSHYWKTNAADWRAFASYRKDLCYHLKKYFLDFLSGIKNKKQDFDLMLTVIDVSLTPELADFIGEDTQNTLSLYKQYNLTLQVEDPSNCWGATPERYDKMGKLYRKYVKGDNKLLFDCNVVASHELGYGGFPSEKPTGEEIRQITYNMGLSKSRSVFYAEDAVFKQDFKNISWVLARDVRIENSVSNTWMINTPYTVSLDLNRSDLSFHLDGKPWYAKNKTKVIVPEGSHMLRMDTLAAMANPIAICSISGEFLNASFDSGNTGFEYEEEIASCYVTVDKMPKHILLDGKESHVMIYPFDSKFTLKLPPGRHKVHLAL